MLSLQLPAGELTLKAIIKDRGGAVATQTFTVNVARNESGSVDSIVDDVAKAVNVSNLNAFSQTFLGASSRIASDKARGSTSRGDRLRTRQHMTQLLVEMEKRMAVVTSESLRQMLQMVADLMQDEDELDCSFRSALLSLLERVYSTLLVNLSFNLTNLTPNTARTLSLVPI